MSWVNDGTDDRMDGSDEPAYDGNGDETSTFGAFAVSLMKIIPLSMNDGYTDEDGTDEKRATVGSHGFVCDDGDEIDLS